MTSSGTHTSSVDLLCVGFGVGGYTRITREAYDAVVNAKYVLHHSGIDDYLRSVCRGQVTSLNPVYQMFKSPAEAYERFADLAVRAATNARSAGGYAVFAVYGHPLLMVSSTRLIEERASAAKLNVRVLPGVSSLDTLLISSPVRLDAGFAVCDATDYLKRNLEFDERLPLLLFQISRVASEELFPAPDPARVDFLATALAKRYGSEHEVHIALTSVSEGLPSVVKAHRICELAANFEDFKVGATLIVPSLEQCPSDLVF